MLRNKEVSARWPKSTAPAYLDRLLTVMLSFNFGLEHFADQVGFSKPSLYTMQKPSEKMSWSEPFVFAAALGNGITFPVAQGMWTEQLLPLGGLGKWTGQQNPELHQSIYFSIHNTKHLLHTHY